MSGGIGDTRSEHLDGKRVNTRLQFGIQRFHDGAVLRETRPAGKFGGGDADAEMRLSTFAPSGMPLMSGRLVNHFKVGWSKFCGKFPRNDVANRHRNTGSGYLMVTC